MKKKSDWRAIAFECSVVALIGAAGALVEYAVRRRVASPLKQRPTHGSTKPRK